MLSRIRDQWLAAEQTTPGVRLGDPRRAEARRRSIEARCELADAFAAKVLPIIKEIRASGVTSMRGIARTLAALGVKTACGGEWSDVQVAAILWP